jgi:outer membrane lipoprotein-sorting protein
VRFIRQTSTSRLIAISTGFVAVAGATAAVAAGTLSSSGTKPPPRALADALAAAASAPEVPGVTARVKFTNNLFPSGVVGGNSPVLAGGTGRLWAASDGRFRLELQSSSGDAQVVGDASSVTVSQPSTSTVYRFVLPAQKPDATDTAKHAAPTAADIQKLLNRIAPEALVSGATPTTVAGQPAYDVRVAPAKNGGLLGAAELAWDAARGVPLRVGIYARGATQPTLELAVTDIAYGAIRTADITVPPPAGAKVQTIDLTKQGSAADKSAKGATADQTVAQVQAAVAFPLHAPATVAGLARTSVRSVGDTPADASALVVYGQGLGAIVVLEQKADAAASGTAKVGGLDLPTVSIAGASGTELATSLGTIAHVTKGGVAYTVLGSVPAAAIEAAARDLVA